MDADVLAQIDPPSTVGVARVVGKYLNSVTVVVLGRLLVDNLKQAWFWSRIISEGYWVATCIQVP